MDDENEEEEEDLFSEMFSKGKKNKIIIYWFNY